MPLVIGAGCDDGDPDDDCGNPVTATICTLVVSSTQVLTMPTTSWSTTTRTHCDTTVGCDVEGATTTSTMTTSAPPADPTYNPAQYYDAYDDSDYTAEQAVFSSIRAWYSSYTKNVDTPSTKTTTGAPAMCTSVFIDFHYEDVPGTGGNSFEYSVEIGGDTICSRVYDCTCTRWLDTLGCFNQVTLKPNNYHFLIDVSNMASYAGFSLTYPDGSVLDGRADLQPAEYSDQCGPGTVAPSSCSEYIYSWSLGDC